MKTIRLSLSIALLSFVALNAQEHAQPTNTADISPKHIIKIHPIDALGGGIGLGYERALTPKLSLDIELFQQFNNVKFDNDQSEINYNLFFETDVRRYFSKRKKVLEGFFIGGGVLTIYNNFDRLRDEDNTTISTDVEELWIGAAVKFGHQWHFKKFLKGITTEANASIDYRTRLGAFNRRASNEIGVLLRVAVGYSW